ncbi:DUF2442 domain-containing protein [Propionivibrio limicola]|nr:DUF2442 domain-containing protein [Propionivibrio limicola]
MSRPKYAPSSQRNNWRLIGKGIGVYWPEIDENIAVSPLLTSQ